MQTHTKEALATLIGFFAISAPVHAGIWFHLFGIPDVRIIGFPFHYFWFVAVAPVALMLAYAIYYRYITTSITREKSELHEAADRRRTTPAGEPVVAESEEGE